MANLCDIPKALVKKSFVPWEAPVAAPVIQSVHPWSRVPKNLSWGGVNISPSFVAKLCFFSCVKTRKCIASCKSKETIAWMLQDCFCNLKHGSVRYVLSHAECRYVWRWLMHVPLSASCSCASVTIARSRWVMPPQIFLWFPGSRKPINHNKGSSHWLPRYFQIFSSILLLCWWPVGYRAIAVPMLKGTGSSDDMISGTGSWLIVLGIAAISKRSEVLLDCCSKYDDTKSVVLNPAVSSAETPPEAVPLEETFLEMLLVCLFPQGIFLEEVWSKSTTLEDLNKLFKPQMCWKNLCLKGGKTSLFARG